MSEPRVIDRPGLAVAPVRLQTLLFARHGATAPNLAGQRCGGDIDPPLAPQGREQALQLAEAVARLDAPPGLVITSDLLRARETAQIVSHVLGDIELQVMPTLRERSLGWWNLEPIADTEGPLARGETPPGGESADAFRHRIEQALQGLAPLLSRRVLLVGSKGVGRVLWASAGLPPRGPLDNAELVSLQLPERLHRAP